MRRGVRGGTRSPRRTTEVRNWLDSRGGPSPLHAPPRAPHAALRTPAAHAHATHARGGFHEQRQAHVTHARGGFHEQRQAHATHARGGFHEQRQAHVAHARAATIGRLSDRLSVEPTRLYSHPHHRRPLAEPTDRVIDRACEA